MLKKLRKKSPGFTIVELITVVTIIGILAAIAVPNYQWGIVRAKEAVLAEDLYNFRSTIDQFRADKGRYPETLDELVKENYIRGSLPKDPFTKSSETWVVVAPPVTGDGQEVKGGVGDVHSGYDGISPSNKIPYNEW